MPKTISITPELIDPGEPKKGGVETVVREDGGTVDKFYWLPEIKDGGISETGAIWRQWNIAPDGRTANTSPTSIAEVLDLISDVDKLNHPEFRRRVLEVLRMT